MTSLPDGTLTDDVALAAKLWRARAEEEAARCATICRARAASHRQTIECTPAQASDLESRAREADKCAYAIEQGEMPDQTPTTLGRIHKSLLLELDQLILERDRANQAYAQLHADHRALLQARDESAARILELRNRIFALEHTT